MRVLRKLGLAALILASCLCCRAEAGWGVSVGYGYGRPYCGYRPYYYPRVGIGVGFYGAPYYPYYVPPPVVVAPPPVVVTSPPVAAPVYPATSYSSPGRLPPPVASTAPPELTQAVASSGTLTGRPGEVSGLLEQLRSPQEQTRMAALTQLGRMKATDAISPVIRVLNEDSSPQVREAAARALGLIGAENALPALQHAALDDNDRDVRHSASYAADVIRSSLQRSR